MKKSAASTKQYTRLPKARIGIIGGSGLYEMEGLTGMKAMAVTTPFGTPSGKYVFGRLEGVPVVFLARHGANHTILPSEINYRANIFAMKKIGVERILSVSAVGSMKKEIVPGYIVIPDQFYDLTKGRESSFFGRGIVAHVSLADPICPELSEVVSKTGEAVGGTIQRGGTYLCMEGPQFSTRAESEVHRGWGVDVIGMTNATEAKLAREAEICYVTIALATDYDCWYVDEAPVSVDMILKLLNENVAFSKRLIKAVVGEIASERHCRCVRALQNAIVTPATAISKPLKQTLKPLVEKYLS
ncbi:MAG: S-methyl-5'-thioadenosine phosphorylase [Nitrospiria bacterium]